MRVLLTGATGLIGSSLLQSLSRHGHEIFALARSPAKLVDSAVEKVFYWTDQEAPPLEAFRGVDAVVHLAGESIGAGRWSRKRKARLRDSRVEGTRFLVQAILALPEEERPRVWVSASAIGLYGDTGENVATESYPPGHEFLSNLVQQWEAASDPLAQAGIRRVLTRFGIVLAREGGALEKMGPFVLGSGRQWMSWVHLADVVGFVMYALENSNVNGAYNVVSAHPVRHREFIRQLAQARGYHIVLPVPAFVLRLVLGEMSELVLNGQRVIPDRLVKSGYPFLFPELQAAFENLYNVPGLEHG